jgi:phenylacetic acid degradation operon negative regulatory protein
VHARSALFDLYGDHLRSRGGQAPVAALVQLLAPVGVAAPAVRTAISRMVRQGWLTSVALPAGPGYRLTPPAVRRLDAAAARIYRTRNPDWSGAWDLLVIEPIRPRPTRERVRSGLTFLGYAPISDSTWIGPVPSAEVATLLDPEELRFSRFAAADDDPATIAARAWDLGALAASYQQWLDFADKLLATPPTDDEQAFAVRFELVHEWRKFLFSDPGLPAVLLPPDWAGHRAARFFDEAAGRLMAGASRYVDSCLSARSSDPGRTHGTIDTTGGHR